MYDNEYNGINLEIPRIWYDVRKCIPGDLFQNRGLPVRCINVDECVDFYFMAYFRSNGTWDFFDDDDLDLQQNMQVTHWCKPIEIDDEGRYEKGVQK